MAGSGCTSAQSAPAGEPGNPSVATTPAATISPAESPLTSAVTQTPTADQVTIVTTTETPKNDLVTVTLNSATKKSKIGLDSNPSPGNVFLVLDVTLQNNDQSKDFDYTDSSFVIIDKMNKKTLTAITSKIKTGLDSPLSKGKIIMKSTKSGQIVFGVPQGPSNNYQLNIVDPTGTLLTSLDGIHAV